MIDNVILDNVFCGLFAFLLVAAILLRSRLRQPKSLLFLVLICELCHSIHDFALRGSVL